MDLNNIHNFHNNLGNYTLECGPNDIIVKLKSCGICGTDLLNIFSRSNKYTLKIGHEVSGIIDKVGPRQWRS